MLNIDLNDKAIKTIMTLVVGLMLAVIIVILAPKAYKTEQTNARNVAQDHKVWLAANTNHDADKDVYY